MISQINCKVYFHCRCRVDQCEVQGQEKVGENIFNASWLQYAIPLEVKDNFLGDTNKFDGCKRFQLITDDPNPINVQGCKLIFSAGNLIRSTKNIYIFFQCSASQANFQTMSTIPNPVKSSSMTTPILTKP